MSDELIYLYAMTDDKVEALRLQLLIVAAFMSVYDEERDDFAEENGIDPDLVYDDSFRDEYELYVFDLIGRMRDRTQVEMKQQSELDRVAFLIAVKHFVDVNFEAIRRTEEKILKQTADLEVTNALLEKDSTARAYKTWHTSGLQETCDVCKALDGVTIPIDEPFLVNGQIIELGDGKEFIYTYETRYAASAHTNCNCYITITIQYE